MPESAHREIFLFPLGTVLLPDGYLPLKIFEQRYLDMTKACIRDETPFGVCLIREGREVGVPAIPEPIGCLARIEQWEMPHPGMFHLLARGGERFRILATSAASNGLMSATVELLPAVTAVEPDAACLAVLKRLMEKIGVENFPQPAKMDDAAWVVYRLAEVLPLDARQRQQILEAARNSELSMEMQKIIKKQVLQ